MFEAKSSAMMISVAATCFALGATASVRGQSWKDPESFRRAQILRELYRSESFRESFRQANRFTSPEERAFLEGKGDVKSLSRDALESLQMGYASLRPHRESRDAILAMHDTVAKQMADLYRRNGIELHPKRIEALFQSEREHFSETSGLTEEQAVEFTRHGGVLDRMKLNLAFRTASQGGVQDRVRSNAKNLVQRASAIRAKGGDWVRPADALRRTTSMAAQHPATINELFHFSRNLDRPARDDRWLAIESLELLLRVGDASRYLPAGWSKDLAKTFAGDDGGGAQVAGKLEAAETAVFNEAKTVIERDRSLGELKKAENLRELMVAMDARLQETSPTSPEFKAIKAIRDWIAARRFMKVIQEYPEFRRMGVEDKVALTALAARANGWGSRPGRIGLVTGLVEIVGVAPLQTALRIEDKSIADAEKIVDQERFKVSEELFARPNLSLLRRMVRNEPATK